MKPFPLHAVLTLATGRVWGPFSDAHALAEHLVGHPVWTHEFVFLADALQGMARAALPGSANIAEAEIPTSHKDVAEKLAVQVAKFGAFVKVAPGNEVREADPLTTLRAVLDGGSDAL